MPLYEYACDSCGVRFERIQKYSDPPIAVCPECGGSVRKLISSPAIQFKGSGFYLTDYGRSGQSGNAESKDGGSKDSGEKAGSKAASEAGGKTGGDAGSAKPSSSESKASSDSKSTSSTSTSDSKK